ncbi:MAG: hypothetical protein HZB56_03960, partial [Deltaproteobacteria bacterium]|nr:hypothetical protein [Deltaproteobacteria bacterium]
MHPIRRAGRRLRALPVLLAAAALASPAPVRAAAPGRHALGVNIAAPSDWDPTQPYADAMKSARRFGSVARPYDEKAAVDARGWPTGDAGVVVMVGVPHMAGTYRLTFTGQARVDAVNTTDRRTRVGRTSRDAGSNTTSADVVVGPAEQNLFLTFTGQAGGVKDVRLMRPGHGPTELFSQPFLARLARFRVLRFMDFLQTNSNIQVQWADRSLPGF